MVYGVQSLQLEKPGREDQAERVQAHISPVPRGPNGSVYHSRILGIKGPCTQIVYTLALEYLNRDYCNHCKARAYLVWVYG